LAAIKQQVNRHLDLRFGQLEENSIESRVSIPIDPSEVVAGNVATKIGKLGRARVPTASVLAGHAN
jgi:hypothetical protein